MFKTLAKVINDCATSSKTGKYEFIRVGEIIGATYLMIMTTALFVKHGVFDPFIFAEAFAIMMFGGGIGIAAKEWKGNKNVT